MNEIESTSVFYTLSTIAQVLAGFIALSAVFVFYKISTFRQEIKLLAHACIEALNMTKTEDEWCNGSIKNLQEAYNNDSYNYFLSILDQIILRYTGFGTPETEISSTAMLHRNFIIGIHDKISLLLKVTRLSIFVGIISIFLSLLTLTFVPEIPYIVLKIIMIIDFLGGAFSLLAMMWVIFFSLMEQKSFYP